MNLTNCSLDVDTRADDGQFNPAPGVSRIEHIWFERTDDGISIRLDGGTQLNVTMKLTNVAGHDFAAMLLRFLDGDAEQHSQ
jgi:hypothetical protein